MKTIDFELPDHGIKGKAQAFDLRTMSRYLDEGAAPGASTGDTNERLMMRHLVELSVDGKSDDGTMTLARKRCSSLPGLFADILAAAAGLPVDPPASKQVDALEDPMPPFLAAKAGLAAEKVTELLAAHPDVPQRLVIVTGAEGKVIFACTVRAPEPEEREVLRAATAKGKGVGAALLSLARACVTWSRDDFETAIATYPAIPTHVLVPEIDELGGGSAEKRFRSGR